MIYPNIEKKGNEILYTDFYKKLKADEFDEQRDEITAIIHAKIKQFEEAFLDLIREYRKCTLPACVERVTDSFQAYLWEAVESSETVNITIDLDNAIVQYQLHATMTESSIKKNCRWREILLYSEMEFMEATPEPGFIITASLDNVFAPIR